MIKKYIIPESIQKIFIVVLFLIIAIIQIGNYSNRMAIAHGDDWPQTYSYLIKYPDRYQNDVLSTYGYQQAFFTLQNIITVSLYIFFNISPDITAYILIIAQFVLLALSLRRFSLTIFQNSLVGVVSALFVVGAKPYNWNLSNYGGNMTQPYAGHLVIPFIIYAFSFVLERKTKLMVVSLLIGSMIHPTLTFYAIVMIGIYDVFSKKNLILSKFHFVLLVLIIFAFLPRLVIQNLFTANNLLTFKEMQYGLENNQHMSLIVLGSRQKAFLFTLPLFFLGLKEMREISKDYLILWFSLLVSCIMFIVLHYIGWYYNILYVIQLMPHRATLIITVLSIPLFINFLFKKSMRLSILSMTLYMVFIYLMISENLSFINSQVYIYFLIAFYIIEFAETFILKNRNTANFFQNLGSWSKRIFGETINKKSRTIITTMIFCILLIFTLIRSLEIGNTSRKDVYYAYYEAQEWIKDNIDEGALIAGSGRVVSQRASVKFVPYSWYVYNRSPEAKDFDDRIYKFFYDWYEDPSLTLQQIRKITLDEEAVAAFCVDFKCDYILRKNNDPLLFELIYENRYYSLYKIPENTWD